MDTFGTAAIIAGGKSTRMGFDKQLLTIDDTFIYHRNIALLRDSFSDILIVTNTPELYENEEVRICHDIFVDMGPLAGIHAALTNSKSKYTFLIACDMPVINPPYINYMKDLISVTNVDVCVTDINGRIETFNSFFSTDLLPSITEELSSGRPGSSSVFKFIKNGSMKKKVIPESDAVKFDTKLNMFKNLNTIDDVNTFYR